MNLTQWEPFADTGRGLNSLLSQNFWRMPRLLGQASLDLQWTPTADISETDTEYLIRAELPAVQKEDIKVQIEGGAIKIEGERKYEKQEKIEKYHRMERFQGKFARSFALPENVDQSGIRAQNKDGVLTVHLPKKLAETAKPAEVKVD
jgi:HSP20 family protein